MPSTAHLTPFDSETGRQAALKSAQVRSELFENGRKWKNSVEQASEPTKAQAEAQRQIAITNEQIRCVREHIKRITADEYGYCEECKRHGADGKELAALLRELRGLMEHVCRLRAIPREGNLKPTAPRQQRSQVVPQAVPEPVPYGLKLMPNTTTPSVQPTSEEPNQSNIP